jgi:hypothetical protein
MESAEFLYGDAMKFALFQMIKPLKFEHFCLLAVFETAFLGRNFGKPNSLKNKDSLTKRPDKSPYSDVAFLAINYTLFVLRSVPRRFTEKDIFIRVNKGV